MTTADGKCALRAQIRSARRARSTAEREAADRGITENAARLVERTGARTIACYLPSPTEPSTRGLLRWAEERGVRVLLPVSLPDGVLDWAEPGGERTSSYGVPEPTGPRLGPGAVRDADLLLIPAAAVDESGTRLGWGLGYYDRLLAQRAPRIEAYVVLYDSEVVDSVPREPHDVPVTGVVTPIRTQTFGR